MVKDLLPPILRPEDMNPLSVLHSILSEGLHSKSDEECLQLAESCRNIITFLVSQISITKNRSNEFSSNMRKLLQSKSKKN